MECQLTAISVSFQTHVIFPHLVVSNDPAYFPEPKRFLPERWLKQSTDAGELDTTKKKKNKSVLQARKNAFVEHHKMPSTWLLKNSECFGDRLKYIEKSRKKA